MNKNRTFLHHLTDISDSILKIRTFIQDFAYEEFYEDEKTQYAVIRALEIIGEAAKQIPDEIKEQYSNIPWQDIVRMRDKLIHHYYGIDLEVIWNTLNEDLNSYEVIYMKTTLLAESRVALFLLFYIVFYVTEATSQKTELLWPNDIQGSEDTKNNEQVVNRDIDLNEFGLNRSISQVSKPTITIYHPPGSQQQRLL